MSQLDYFVVGRDVALETRPHFDSATHPRLDLTVLEPRAREIGWVHTELFGDHVSVSLHWSDEAASHNHEVEVIRLVARVLVKLVAVEVRISPVSAVDDNAERLHADGFRCHSDQRWYLAPLAPLALPAPSVRADSMEELYSDPFNITWNFEPRPWNMLPPLLTHVSALDGANVLDVGCGFGKNARLLEGLGMRVHGVDVAASAIVQCRRWVRHPERFVDASIDSLPHASANFDAVLDVGCLHCLPAALRAPGIAELARVLKPGGWLFSRVLLPRDQRWLSSQAFAVNELGITPSALAQLLEPCFEVAFTTDDQATYLRARRRGGAVSAAE